MSGSEFQLGTRLLGRRPSRYLQVSFLFALAQRQRVRRHHLGLAPVELDKLLLELLARLFQPALLLGVVLLQLVELGVQLGEGGNLQ